MTTRTIRLIFAVSLLLPGTALLAQDNDDDDTFDFGARLSGAQEVVPPEQPTTPSPGVSTGTTGNVQVRVARDLSSFEFQLVVENGVGITQAHLHCGRPGQNGPVIVFLAPLNEGGEDVNGVLGEGTRTNENIEQTAEECEALIGRPVRNIASLAAAAFDGLIYANAHSVANPAGEVRGQLIFGEDDDDGVEDGPEDGLDDG